MYRITEKMLESRVNHLNKLTNSPETSYTKSESGQYVANIGNYHLSFAYGGVALERMECAGGSVSSTFNCGHVPKRELMQRIDAYIAGINDTR